MPKLTRTLQLVLLLCLFRPDGFGQSAQTTTPKQPQPAEEVGEDDVVRVNTTLVGVPVTVLDRDGRFVPGLKREDFHVYEDGVEQEITYFAPVEANVTVLLLFDHFVKNYRETARDFAGRLRAGDKVIVARFGDTRYEILNKVSEGEAGVQQEPHRVKWRFGTSIHDAVDAAIRRMNSIQGRRAILLFSDGILPKVLVVTKGMSGQLISERESRPSERATARATINEAEESDAPVYVLQYDTMTDFVRNGPSPGVRYPEVLAIELPRIRNEYEVADEYLHALAEKSGGRLYAVPSGTRLKQAEHPPALPQAFTQISAELRQQYSLGYYPKQAGQAGGRHEIKVRVARPDVAVRSRTSYVSAPPKP
jgi:Ca-activated chloride channel homolog